MNTRNDKGGELWAKIPFGLRERLHELKGARLHVWLACRLHANRDGWAWAGLNTLAQETGYHKDVIARTKAWLRWNRWLEIDEFDRRAKKKGFFGVTPYRAVIPDPVDETELVATTDDGEEIPF
jgi:hypothetical protein